MSANEDYRAFFDLLVGNDDVFLSLADNEDYKDIEPIFETSEGENSKMSGIGPVVTSFNNSVIPCWCYACSVGRGFP